MSFVFRLRRRPLLTAAVSFLALYGISFSVMAWRRWACAVPWTGQCWVDLGDRIEDVILFTWVKQPETLITGAVAALAAWTSIRFLARQVGQSERHERRRLKRRHRAARAVMPHTLSAITRYAQSSAETYDTIYRHRREDDTIDWDSLPPLERPRLDRLQIADLQLMVEASSGRLARPLVALLSKLQIHESRSQSFEVSLLSQGREGRRYQPMWLVGEIICAADIHAQATDLFVLMRPSEGPATEQRQRITLQTSLLLMGITSPEAQQLAVHEEANRPPSLVPGIAPPPRPASR